VGVRGTATQNIWSLIEMELARRQGQLVQHQQGTITTSTTTTTMLQQSSATTAVSAALHGCVKVEKNNEKVQEVPHQCKMRQVLLHGDNVIMVYWAAQEQLAWPTLPPTSSTTTPPLLSALQS